MVMMRVLRVQVIWGNALYYWSNDINGMNNTRVQGQKVTRKLGG